MAKALPRGIALRDRNALEEFRAIQTDLAASAPSNPSQSPDGKNKMAGAVSEP
jgi:hypothetical protein